MANTWVVVADRKRARIFWSKDLLSPLHEEQDLILAADAASGYSDKPGRTTNRMGEHRHGLQKENTAADVELERFAKTISVAVDKVRTGKGMDELVLVAPPELLGELRTHLSRPAAHLVTHELHKDMVHMTADEIRKHLGTS